MVRLLVQFTAAQVKSLRAAARRRGRPVAALVRESVEAHLGRSVSVQAAQPDRWERARRAVGGFRSGVRDLGARHDRYLGAGNRW